MIIVFLILAVVLFVAALQLGKSPLPNAGRNAGILKIVAVVVGVGAILSSTLIQINAGQVGVKSMFGKIDDEVLQPGLNVVNPLYQVTEFDTRTQNYTMSLVHDEGEKQGDDAIRVLSKDGLEVILDITILYRVLPERAPAILKTIGIDYTEKIVRPLSRTRTRDVAVYYDAVALFSTSRDEFQAKITKDIERDLKARGIILEELLVRNIQLPAKVKESIEGKITAEQESQKMTFVLSKERQEADRKRVEAQGISDYQRIISQGLTKELLQYESIKAQKDIALSPNAKVIVMDGKSGANLMINDK
jgi:regulator of protease activity HflC (stomatin/prohibitin superfamily)